MLATTSAQRGEVLVFPMIKEQPQVIKGFVERIELNNHLGSHIVYWKNPSVPWDYAAKC